MERMIYDVLCEIRDGNNELRLEIRDVKYEVSRIQGIGEYTKDLHDVYNKLEDIESEIRYMQ